MTLFPSFSTGVPLAVTMTGCVLKPQTKTFPVPESGVLLQGLWLWWPGLLLGGAKLMKSHQSLSCCTDVPEVAVTMGDCLHEPKEKCEFCADACLGSRHRAGVCSPLPLGCPLSSGDSCDSGQDEALEWQMHFRNKCFKFFVIPNLLPTTDSPKGQAEAPLSLPRVQRALAWL